jgi:HEAT repeat protein
VRRLIEHLKTAPSDEADHTRQVLEQMHVAGLPVAPHLFELLAGSDVQHRLAATEIFRNVFQCARGSEGSQEDVDRFERTLLLWLTSREPVLRLAAANGLGDLYRHEGLLDAAVPDEARAGLDAFARAAETSPAVPALIRTLEDPDGEVRTASAFSLGLIYGGLKDSPAVPPLVRRMQDPWPEVRTATVNALEMIGAVKAVPALLERLGACQPGDAEATHIAQVLATIAPAQAQPAVPVLLLGLREGPDWNPYVARYLLRIQPVAPHTLRAVERLLHRDEDSAREAAVEALGSLGPTAQSTLTSLLGLLDSDDPRERVMVLQAAAKIGPSSPAVRQRLLKLSRQDASEWVRSVASEALAGLAP